MTQDFFYGTGKRKTSIARTRLYNGSGQIIVMAVLLMSISQGPLCK